MKREILVMNRSYDLEIITTDTQPHLSLALQLPPPLPLPNDLSLLPHVSAPYYRPQQRTHRRTQAQRVRAQARAT